MSFYNKSFSFLSLAGKVEFFSWQRLYFTFDIRILNEAIMYPRSIEEMNRLKKEYRDGDILKVNKRFSSFIAVKFFSYWRPWLDFCFHTFHSGKQISRFHAETNKCKWIAWKKLTDFDWTQKNCREARIEPSTSGITRQRLCKMSYQRAEKACLKRSYIIARLR